MQVETLRAREDEMAERTCAVCGATYDPRDGDHVRAGGADHLPWLCRDVLRAHVSAAEYALTVEHDRAERYRKALVARRGMSGPTTAGRARAAATEALSGRTK